HQLLGRNSPSVSAADPEERSFGLPWGWSAPFRPGNHHPGNRRVPPSSTRKETLTQNADPRRNELLALLPLTADTKFAKRSNFVLSLSSRAGRGARGEL